MPEFFFDLTEFDEFEQSLRNLVPSLMPYLREGAKDAGRYARDRAEAYTRSKGAVGVTKGFVNGWKWRMDSGSLALSGEVRNDVPYAAVVEYGRRPGRPMPPHSDVFEAWLLSKGLDPKLSFVIRRAIGRDGTKGRRILEEVMQRDRAQIFVILERAFRNGLERVWR